MLLSTAYFPPISWFALIAKDFTISGENVKSSSVYIEACENYQKQTYRNRCKFYSSQGVEVLNVPIIHGGDDNITRIGVDYSTNWIHKTKRAILSAYMNSAFFEYYKDELFAILESKPLILWELNMELIQFFLTKIGIKAEIRLTTEFVQKGSSQYGQDYRYLITPKKENTILKDLGLYNSYFQVFAHKYGFISDLSIMDLLFNLGPESIIYLKNTD